MATAPALAALRGSFSGALPRLAKSKHIAQATDHPLLHLTRSPRDTAMAPPERG